MTAPREEQLALGTTLPAGYRVDLRGTLEMKLATAETAAKYARTKAEREQAAQVAATTARRLRNLP